MMHTGDEYETLARTARHYELHRISKALTGILFGVRAEPSTNRAIFANGGNCANDQTTQKTRAA